MKGIDIITDHEGQLKEIHVKATAHPDLAADMMRLIKIKHRNTGLAQVKARKKPGAMSLTEFRQLIQDAKKSGELSEQEFFQSHPEWRKNGEQSSPGWQTLR